MTVQARPPTKPLYICLTLRGKIHPDDWRRVLQEVETALATVKDVRITAISTGFGDDKVMEMRR